MDFPVTGDTHDEYKYFVKLEKQDHKINIPAPVGGCTQGDLLIHLPWVCIADETITAAAALAGATVSCHVTEGIRVVTRQIDPGSTFNTVGQELWFNTVDGLLYDTEDDGLYLVGYLDEVTDADGCIAFEKRRYTEVGVGT